MKKLITLAAIMLAISAYSGQQANANSEPVKLSSLAGDVNVTDVRPADEMPVYPARGKSIERTFVHQPPIIPHKATYAISADKNGCLSCHSWDKAKRMKATPVDKSHVLDDKGTVQGMYYFCDQCHVPQAENKQQLVENTFN